MIYYGKYYGYILKQIIYDKKRLDKILEQCKYDELIYRLKLGGLEEIIEKIKEFDGYLYKSGVRTKYNYIKHRGVYHYMGLGENYTKMLIRYEDIEPKVLSREEINIEEWTKILLDFDDNFVEYFNYILQKIVPEDYCKKINMMDSKYVCEYIKYCERIKNSNLI